MSKRSRARVGAPLTILLALVSLSAAAQVPLRDDHSGPYNVTILEGGEGLTRKLEPGTASLEANGSWSMTGWVNTKQLQGGGVLLLAVGGAQADGRALMLRDGKPALWAGGKGTDQQHAARRGSLDRESRPPTTANARACM